MNEKTRTKALDALDGMRQIVKREMLITGTYVESDVSRPDLAGAICGGRKHCAIGSLWVGYGIRPAYSEWSGVLVLSGVDPFDRSEFLRNRPGLRVAYNALNDASQRYADRHELGLEEDTVGGKFDAPIEALFEGYYGSVLTKKDLLTIIASAKRKVKTLP